MRRQAMRRRHAVAVEEYQILAACGGYGAVENRALPKALVGMPDVAHRIWQARRPLLDQLARRCATAVVRDHYLVRLPRLPRQSREDEPERTRVVVCADDNRHAEHGSHRRSSGPCAASSSQCTWRPASRRRGARSAPGACSAGTAGETPASTINLLLAPPGTVART